MNSRYSQSQTQVSKSVSINTNKQTTLIKEHFKDEILEIGSYLYLQMGNDELRKDAIKAWDNFEYLINHSTDDKEALTRMINLLKRIEKNCTSVVIHVNEEKCNKLLNKNI